MNNTMRAFVTVAALAASLASAQVYKYIDKDGKVQYTDRPPDDAKKTEVRVDKPAEGAKAGNDDWKEKEQGLNRRLAEKRRVQDQCAELRELIRRFEEHKAKHPRERWFYNGREITPAVVENDKRMLRDTCAN